jgi:SAM-dependent methyltransferase
MTWWLDLYDEALAELLLVQRDPDEVRRTVDFLVRALGLPPGGRVFDQCCGTGGLAVPLAERGHEVVGCDLGVGRVERALAEAEERGLSLELYQADARSFVPGVPCHGAFDWWGRFAHAEEDETNLKLLRCAREALWPGGWFVLGCANVARALRAFEAHVETRGLTPEGEVVLGRRSRIDLLRMVDERTWRVMRADGSVRGVESRVRLYTPHELEDLLHRAGFVEVSFVGDLDGSPLGLDSPRCIAVARRKPA